MLGFICFYCNAECRYAECHYADCRGAGGSSRLHICHTFNVTVNYDRKKFSSERPERLKIDGFEKKYLNKRAICIPGVKNGKLCCMHLYNKTSHS
jgi:hypothetical protein